MILYHCAVNTHTTLLILVYTHTLLLPWISLQYMHHDNGDRLIGVFSAGMLWRRVNVSGSDPYH